MTIKIAAALQSRAVLDDRGASLVEYALLVALLALVAVIAVAFFGGQLSDEYDSISTQLP